MHAATTRPGRVAGLVLALLLSGHASWVGAQSQPEVVSRGWLPHAQSLVRGEQPVGVVLHEGDLVATVGPDVPAGARSTVNESKRGKVTRLMSERAPRCTLALERPVEPLVLRGTPLSVLYDLVMQDGQASSKVPPGIVGGTSSSHRSGERLGQQIDVRVEEGDTLGMALDGLVSAGMPLGWGVIEYDAASASPCAIILFTEDTVLWTPYDALFARTGPSRQ